MKERVMKARFLLFILLPALVGSAFSQGVKKPRTLDDYSPRTLKELAALSDSRGSSGRDGEVFPSRVRVTYSGSTRPLPQLKKDVIAEWARRFAGMPEFYTVPYEKEVLFSEEGHEHWLAVKKEFLSEFAKELRNGDVVELYLIQLGRIRTGDKWEAVLLVEKFAKPQKEATAKPPASD